MAVPLTDTGGQTRTALLSAGQIMDYVDPSAADSRDALAACLRDVHLRADKPTYRTLDTKTVHDKEPLPGTRLKRVRLTRSTLSEMLAGRKFPSKAFMLTFVEACGVDLETDRRWEEAWDRLAPHYQQVPALGETEKLRQENEELRRRLSEAQRRADAELEQVRAWADARQTAAEDELEELRRQLAEAKGQVGSAEPTAQLFKSLLDAAIGHTTNAEDPLEGEQELSSRFVSVTLPQTIDDLTEGTVTRWLKAEGESVEEDEPLLEVSDGVTGTEILSPAAGILRDIAVGENEAAAVGAQLAVIEEAQPAGQREPIQELRLMLLVVKRSVGPAPAETGFSGECPVIMPQTIDDLTEGTVTRWLKAEGESVEEDEPLLEVSDGVTGTEILSPAAGILRDIAVGENEAAAVGAQLAVIEEAQPAGHEPQARAVVSMTVIRRLANPAPAETGFSGECPVIMPQTIDDLTEGTVTRWLKAEGESVEEDEPLLEVSDGVTGTEILSPAAGILRDIAVGENEAAAVGAQLARDRDQ